MNESQPLALELIDITKTYGSLRANDSVQLRVQKGCIHAIVGENGAGKSTAMKMVFGLVRPDSGQIKVFGQGVEMNTPKAAMKLGIGMVHQHFMLSDRHTVLDNLLLGSESSSKRALSNVERKGQRKEIENLIRRLDFEIPLDEVVETLSVGVQQRIEIVKVLRANPRIIIFDEPTAVLAPAEVDSFYKLLGDLKDQGKTILLITHKIAEVVNHADFVSVLRGGRHIHTTEVASTNEGQIARWMVGDIGKTESRDGVRQPKHQKEILSWRSSTLPFVLREGEILGVVGVEGNGQSELIDCILDPSLHREMFDIREIHWMGRSTNSFGRGKGISLIAQDRHEQGVLLEKTLLENFLLGNYRSSHWIRWKTLRKTVEELLGKFNVFPRDSNATMGSLSGGNQQKFVVARESACHPKLLIAAQPTRGVDLNAANFIHNELQRVSQAGAAILLVTSDLDEALKLSDRIVVMFKKKFIGEFQRSHFDREAIGLRMGGVAV